MNATRLRGPLAVIAVAAAVVVLRSEREWLIPVVISALIAYALDPLVIALEKRRVPRAAGSVVVMFVVLSALVALGSLLANDALTLVEQLPETLRQLRTQLFEARSYEGGLIERLQRVIAALRDAAAVAREAPAAPIAAPVGDYLMRSATALVSVGSDTVVVLFLVFFLLLSGDLFRRKLVTIAGAQFSRRRVVVKTLREIERRVRRFFLVRIVTGLIVAVATWLALRWLGLDHAAVWGVIAGACNAIPYLGPVIVSVALLVVGLSQFGDVSTALSAALIALVITSLEGWLLDPVLMGKAERMNAVAVLVGLVFWTSVWGMWGALLAVPILAIFQAVCSHVTPLRPVGKLLEQ